jgi:hypothetical protein
MRASDDKFNLFVGPGSDQFPLRFPDGYRDQIKAAAKANGRSMNAEVLYRLMAYDAANPKPSAPAVVDVDTSQVDAAIVAVERLKAAAAEASEACRALGIRIEVRE